MITTCDETLHRPGVCCDNGADDPGPTFAACREPARYAVLVEHADELREHLRCVRHAASTRAAGGPSVVAMKDYHPRRAAS